MNKTDTWMPLFIGDYLADTMHLSAEEHGAYLLLIMHYWREGGAIKNDKNLIKNICKISAKKCENILAFFEQKDGLLFHKRIDDEIAKSVDKQKKKRNQTEAARAARNNSNSEKNDSVTTPVTETPLPLPSPSPITPNNKNLNLESSYVGRFKISDLIDEKGIEQARKVAPGWDVYHLMHVYDEWAQKNNIPKPDRPVAAFIGWLKKFTKGMPPS